MEKETLVITDCDHIDFLQEEEVCAANGIELKTLDLHDEEEAVRALYDYPVVGNQYLRFTESLLSRLPNLRCIVRYGIGVDNIDLEAATRHGVAVCNVPDYGTQEVAAHAFAMMMALTRKLKTLNQSVARGEWDYSISMPIYRYSEITVGVIGYGRIGRAFTEMAHSLGCRIAACDILFPPELSTEARKKYSIPDYVQLMTLEDLFASCNVISIHVMLTPENGGCVRKELLEKMRPDAFFINVSRGGLVDENDLYEVLRDGKIAGAAIDTWKQEPTDPANPLLHMDNVVATPHSAWYSEQASADLKRKLAEECVRALRGQALKNQVNKF